MTFHWNRTYAYQARLMLQNEFPRISCAAIDSIILHSKSKFTDAFHILRNIEYQRRFGAIDDDGQGKFESIDLNVKVFIKSNRPKKRFRLSEQQLCAEIEAIPELNTKHGAVETPKKKVVIDLTLDEDEEEVNDELNTKEKAGSELNTNFNKEEVDHDAPGGEVSHAHVECLCCYGDYPRSEMVECKTGSGHNVCKDCIGRYVSEQLDGNDSVAFSCIVDTDCENMYSTRMLDQDGVLSPKLKERMNDRVFRETMKQCSLDDDVWTCPTCAHIGFIDKLYPWVECPSCNGVKYCTSCNDVYHEKKTCEQARMEKAGLNDPKHRAHEAMSKATKRFCPHCTQEYIKGDGCNKITCTKCKTLSCYLCGGKVNNYSHFCNHKLPPGVTKCPCGKACRLFTSTEAMQEIDRAKRHEAGRKVLVEAGITDEKEIVYILASPTKKSSASNTAAPAPNNPPPLAAELPPVAAANIDQRIAPIERNQPQNQNAAAAQEPLGDPHNVRAGPVFNFRAPDAQPAAARNPQAPPFQFQVPQVDNPPAANLNPQAPPFQFRVPQVVNPQPAARNLDPPFMFGHEHQVWNQNAFNQEMEALNQQMRALNQRLQRDAERRLREAQERAQQQPGRR